MGGRRHCSGDTGVLLHAGELAAFPAGGFLLGRPGHEALVPGRWVEMMVGNSPDVFLVTTGWVGGVGEQLVRFAWPVWSCLFAALAGAAMYFATLTEVQILQALMGSGMGKGPALSMLLAGPALSLPNTFVIASVLGGRKTLVFVGLVVVMATATGVAFGRMAG